MMVFRLCSQVLENALLHEFFHQIPIFNHAVSNRILKKKKIVKIRFFQIPDFFPILCRKPNWNTSVVHVPEFLSSKYRISHIIRIITGKIKQFRIGDVKIRIFKFRIFFYFLIKIFCYFKIRNFWNLWSKIPVIEVNR